MSFKGYIEAGAAYQVVFRGGASNRGRAFLMHGWIPKGGGDPRSQADDVGAGEEGVQTGTAPAANDYHGLAVEVDLAVSGDSGHLTVQQGRVLAEGDVGEDSRWIFKLRDAP